MIITARDKFYPRRAVKGLYDNLTPVVTTAVGKNKVTLVLDKLQK